MAAGARGHPDGTFGLVTVMPQDVEAVVEQIAGVARTGVTGRARMPSAAGAPDAVLVFVVHL